MTTIDDRAAELEQDQTAKDLSQLASELGIPGRGSMDKAELARAIAEAEAEAGPTGTVTIGGQTHTVDRVAGDGSGVVELDLEPGTPDEVGRPDLLDTALTRAADRRPARVIGEAPTPNTEEN